MARVDLQWKRLGGGTKPLAPAARAACALALALIAVPFAALVALAQDQGTIEGVVIDSKSGEPIIEAGVEVIGQNKKVKTDLDGKYMAKQQSDNPQPRDVAVTCLCIN